MTTNQVTVTLRTAELPAALRTLVKQTRCRPEYVDVTFQTGATTVISSSRHVKVVGGGVLSTVDSGRMGDDGEWNPTTTTTYDSTVAVVSAWSRFPRSVDLYVGNVPATVMTQLEAALTRLNLAHRSCPTVSPELAAVAVDAALEMV